MTTLTTEDGQRHRVTQERRPSRSYGAKFMIVFTEAMKSAAKHIKQGLTLRVLLILPDHLNFVDFRQRRTVELADEIGTNSGNISRAMNELHSLGILEREGRGPRTAWRFTTDWGWNDTPDKFHAFRAGRLKNKKPPRPVTTKSPIMPIMESRAGADHAISITIPSKPGSIPAGSFLFSHAQSMS